MKAHGNESLDIINEWNSLDLIVKQSWVQEPKHLKIFQPDDNIWRRNRVPDAIQ